jgi:transcriptional regulator with XRE-family HTH domain
MDPHINFYDVVLGHLRRKKIPQKVVARDSGVPFSTVAKIAQVSITNPSVHTVQKLYDYFSKVFPESSQAIESQPALHVECCSGDPRHGERRKPDRRDLHDRRENGET